MRTIEKLRCTLKVNPKKVILGDNIVEYIRRGHDGLDPREFPTLAPPWKAFWAEYPTLENPRLRCGIYALDRSDDEEFVQQISSTFTGEQRTHAGWFVQVRLFGDHPDFREVHPIGDFIICLDKLGREFAVKYAQETTSMEVVRMLVPWHLTLAFLHCKNVTLRQHRPPNKNRGQRKRGQLPYYNYSTIQMMVPRSAREASSAHHDNNQPAAHQIIAGHFQHSGDCCPGIHSPNGRIFGRETGVFWVPMHTRGSLEHGEIKTDWDLRVRQ